MFSDLRMERGADLPLYNNIFYTFILSLITLVSISENCVYENIQSTPDIQTIQWYGLLVNIELPDYSLRKRLRVNETIIIIYYSY